MFIDVDEVMLIRYKVWK